MLKYQSVETANEPVERAQGAIRAQSRPKSALPVSKKKGGGHAPVTQRLFSLLLVLDSLTLCGKIAGTFKLPPLPMAHLNRIKGVIGGNFLDRLAATDRLHSNPNHACGDAGGPLAQLLRGRPCRR